MTGCRIQSVPSAHESEPNLSLWMLHSCKVPIGFKRRPDTTRVDGLCQKKGEIEKRRIEVRHGEQMPWFYNDAIPPTPLLARAKPFPSLYPINSIRPLNMPSWM